MSRITNTFLRPPVPTMPSPFETIKSAVRCSPHLSASISNAPRLRGIAVILPCWHTGHSGCLGA
eukprot:10696745-Lingulodinium_polyedra.AAC.1